MLSVNNYLLYLDHLKFNIFNLSFSIWFRPISQKGKGRVDTLNVAYGDSLNALNELFLICLLWLKTSHMQVYYHMLNGRMLLLE